MRYFWGGSQNALHGCKPSNAKELFANPDVDGGLIADYDIVVYCR